MVKLENCSNAVNAKIEKLRELMSDRGIDFYIVPTSDRHGSEYIDEAYKIIKKICGFTGSDSTLVVSLNEAALFVDGRYHIQADIETSGTCINVYKVGCKDVDNYSTYLKKHVKEGDTVAFNGRVVMKATLDELSKSINASFEYELDLISELVDKTEPKAEKIILLNDDIKEERCDKKLDNIHEKIKKNKKNAIV